MQQQTAAAAAAVIGVPDGTGTTGCCVQPYSNVCEELGHGKRTIILLISEPAVAEWLKCQSETLRFQGLIPQTRPTQSILNR